MTLYLFFYFRNTLEKFLRKQSLQDKFTKVHVSPVVNAHFFPH